MNFPLSLKELILLGAGSVVAALLLPILIVPFLAPSPNVVDAKDETIELPNATTDEALINHCRGHIATITNRPQDDIRIDFRSTGVRDVRFNVHGFVRQPGGEYDFQCWYAEDRSFDSHFIGRVSLEEIRRKSALDGKNPF